MDSKICNTCLTDKPLSDFYAAKHGKQGRKAVCKVCVEKNKNRVKENEYLKNWRQANPVDRDKVNAYNRQRFIDNPDAERLRRKRSKLKRQYNLTVEQFEYLVRKQESKCAICRETKPLVIDHDHKCCPDKSTSCGKCIRGLLCANCNRGIGYLRDNPVTLLRAAEYVTLDRLELPN